MPRTRHTVSGVIDENTPEHMLTHPLLGKFLEVVDENAKPLLPVMHRPATVDVKEPVEPSAPSKKIGKD